MPTHSTLTVQHLGKHYGGTPVFAQVHFAVQPGEFVEADRVLATLEP